MKNHSHYLQTKLICFVITQNQTNATLLQRFDQHHTSSFTSAPPATKRFTSAILLLNTAQLRSPLRTAAILLLPWNESAFFDESFVCLLTFFFHFHFHFHESQPNHFICKKIKSFCKKEWLFFGLKDWWWDVKLKISQNSKICQIGNWIFFIFFSLHHRLNRVQWMHLKCADKLPRPMSCV